MSSLRRGLNFFIIISVSDVQKFLVKYIIPGLKEFTIQSLIAQLVKNPHAMQETPVWFLDQEDLLEKGLATHSSILGLLLWLRW